MKIGKIIMANLKSFINNTKAVVDNLEYGGEPRPYLGMSGIGLHCSRALWYGFHWVDPKKHDAKKERIFNAGHMFEPQIVRQLKDAGMEVFRSYKDTEQNRKRLKNWKLNEKTKELEVEHFGMPDEEQEEYIGFAGHAKGHCDGRIRGVIEDPEVDHILEIKTMKDSSFKELGKKGLKRTNEVYYAQTQRYMKASGLKWSLFIVVNKNTAQIYIERIKFNEVESHELVVKEQMIIMSDVAPFVDYPKDYYKCGWCDFKEVCKEGKDPQMNCRTCEYSDLENNGIWSCSYKDKKISTEEQRKGCKHYKRGWEL